MYHSNRAAASKRLETPKINRSSSLVGCLRFVGAAIGYGFYSIYYLAKREPRTFLVLCIGISLLIFSITVALAFAACYRHSLWVVFG